MSEETLAAAILPQLIFLSRPTDKPHGSDEPYGDWGVYVGSKGGDGPTLREAMVACLDDDDLGDWWRCDFGEGEFLREFFDRMCREHLGRPLCLKWSNREARP